MSDNFRHVEDMIEKASKADKGGEAMQFAQAALNAANALCSLETAKNLKVK